MNDDEEHVERYLNGLGLGCVIYEPDGNVPPDFTLGGSIAVEVRRLNLNKEEGNRAQGLEERAIPITQMVFSLTDELSTGAPAGIDGTVNWLTIWFQRPLPSKRRLREGFKDILRRQSNLQDGMEADYSIEPNFKVEIRCHAGTEGARFEIAAIHDLDATVWVQSATVKNLKLCVAEKTEKIAPYLDRYPRWWLVLTDHLGVRPDYNSLDLSEFEKSEWERVVVLDRDSVSEKLSVYPSKL